MRVGGAGEKSSVCMLNAISHCMRRKCAAWLVTLQDLPLVAWRADGIGIVPQPEQEKKHPHKGLNR
jgi:hypothetical protein